MGNAKSIAGSSCATGGILSGATKARKKSDESQE